MADATAEERARARVELAWRRAKTLSDWIPLASPGYESPTHLSGACDVFDRITAGEPTFALIEAPPRHAKTETAIHGAVRALKTNPRWRVGYTTHTADLAKDKSREAREVALRCGLWASETRDVAKRFDPAASVRLWETDQRGSFMALGRGGKPIGRGFNLLVVDDPFGSLEDAESQTIRDMVWRWYTGTLFSRLEPGASLVVIHQRWHDDDLIGRIREQARTEPNAPDWIDVSLPVLRGGVPLWDRYSLDDLRRIEASVGSYVWQANYMQAPKAKGARLFGGDPARHESPITLTGKRLVIAVDPAASTRTSADRWVIGLGAVSGSGDTLTVDVVRVWAFRAEVPDGVAFVALLQKVFGCEVVAEGGGTQKGVPQTIRRLADGLFVNESTPDTDKFAKWQPAAAAWRRGALRVPAMLDPLDPVEARVTAAVATSTAELRELWVGLPDDWLTDYLSEMGRITGLKDRHDDTADMTALLWDWAEARYKVEVTPWVSAPREGRRLGGF